MNNKFKTFTGHIKKILLYVLSLIATVVITALITTVVNKKLEKAGEPKIKAIVESIVLFQSLTTNDCEGEIVFNITNLENKPTFLNIDTIYLNIPTTDKRIFSIYINQKLPINGFEVRKDTIHFNLPERHILGEDSFICPNIESTTKLYYPNNKIAEIVRFDTTISQIKFIYNWVRIPSLAFYALRNDFNKHLLINEWKKVEVTYFGTNYDCYYHSTDSNEIRIDYVGERLKYTYGDDKYCPIENDSGKIFDNFVFVPHPKIEDKFVNIDNRDIHIYIEQRNKEQINVVQKVIGVRRGYVQAFNIRY